MELIFILIIGAFILILYQSNQLEKKDENARGQAIDNARNLGYYLEKLTNSDLEQKLSDLEPEYEALV